jgi:hypothetical protein
MWSIEEVYTFSSFIAEKELLEVINHEPDCARNT